MKKKSLSMLLVLFTIVTTFSQTLDQSWAPASVGGGTFSASPAQNVGQSFTAGITGDLSQINLRLIDGTSSPSTTFVAGDFQVRIFNGNGYSGTLLSTTVVNISSVSTSYQEQIITLSTLVPITQGNSYTIDFRGITGTVGIQGANSGYAGGGLYFSNGNNALYDSYDLWFKTFVNVPTPATHLNFDGTNDLVNLGTTLTSSFVGKTQSTIEAWVRPQTNTGLGVIAGNYDYPTISTGMQMLLRRDNNGYIFSVDGGSGFNTLTASNTVVLNTWQHIVGTWDGTTIRIYINGILIGSQSATGAFGVRPNSFVIGGNAQTVPEKFRGNIDEVRIWDVARTAEQINGSMNCELQGTETGLQAYYKFNQGVDQANNAGVTTLTATTGPDGTLTNFALTGATSNWLAGSTVTTGSIVPSSATVTTPVVYNQGATASALTATTGTNGSGLLWYTAATGGTGSSTAPTPSTATPGNTSYWVSSTNANGCESTRTEIVVRVNAPATHLNFDGVDDIVTLPISVSGTASGSVEMWIQPTSLTSVSLFQRQHDFVNTHTTIDMGLNVNGSGGSIPGKIYFHLKNGIPNLSSTTILTVGQWYHITATWNGTSASLYINGVLEQTLSGAYSGLVSTGGYLNLGGFNGGSKFQGNMDELRVWNRSLSTTEIVNNLNCELSSPSTQVGLTAYYQFNQGFNAANNSTITTLIDASPSVNNGTLTNFTLTSSTSNWLSGSTIVTGSNCTPLSIGSFEVNSKIKMYPNPSSNFVTIEVTSLTNVKLQVLDVTGKVLMNESLNNTTNSVNVQQLPTGLYFFKVTSNEGTATSKIVKN